MGSRFKAVVGTVVAGLLITAALVAQTQDPWIGTWKLNVAKSKFSPGPPPKDNVLKIEPAAGGALKHTFDGVNAEGQTTHSERIGKFDGVEIPVQNVLPATTNKNTSAFRRLDDHSFEVVSRVNGKITTTNKVVISADGKTMTQTSSGTNAAGQPTSSMQVYERQQ
jgi:opacity protein-like surface antigen